MPFSLRGVCVHVANAGYVSVWGSKSLKNHLGIGSKVSMIGRYSLQNNHLWAPILHNIDHYNDMVHQILPS